MIRIRRDVVESQNIAQITVQPELRLPLQVRVHFLCHGIIENFTLLGLSILSASTSVSGLS